MYCLIEERKSGVAHLTELCRQKPVYKNVYRPFKWKYYSSGVHRSLR